MTSNITVIGITSPAPLPSFLRPNIFLPALHFSRRLNLRSTPKRSFPSPHLLPLNTTTFYISPTMVPLGILGIRPLPFKLSRRALLVIMRPGLAHPSSASPIHPGILRLPTHSGLYSLPRNLHTLARQPVGIYLPLRGLGTPDVSGFAARLASGVPDGRPSDNGISPDSAPPEGRPKPLTLIQKHHLTKQELLARTTNLYDRIKVRFRWMMSRSARPFNTDDFSAFFSWIMISNVFLLIAGTTTFVSVVIFLANTVFAQELVAQKLGEFITRNSGLTVIFESAIVPGWSDGKISFNKCYVSMRPKQQGKFEKGSQAAAVHPAQGANTDDGNYTQFDLTIEQVNVSLSFHKWINGHGIVKDVELRGMRGEVDRTFVHWEEGDLATNYKNVAAPGDFEIDLFIMEDVLFTLKQPDGFRHFEVSIFNCDLPQFRKHWLFYDILNANHMSGSYDGSLFTIHKKQRIDDFHLIAADIAEAPGGSSSPWKRVTQLRIDSLNVDHLNTGLQGPFGWITSGQVDMLADFMVPEEDGFNVAELVQMISENFAKEARRYNLISNGPPSDVIKKDISKYIVMDLQVKLNNVRAGVPLFTPDLSYINNALIRPIVAYINSKNTYIPIKCRVVKKLEDFAGSWTIYDCLLMDDLSAEVYDAFAEYVTDEAARAQRMRKIGFWSLQVMFQLLLMSLGTLA
ncbi:hypothetical protein BABINDRAFT_141470 [Babjeviella inositovora NRRL Y-12698]|uniref:Mitochondrial distribution and morphology protein 31 n=1 Tax=Babjeviella inositovora NRRL Y-12698 TaxID=984486 RepID=A0A1E3QQU8_9ASCO|nr:uncharacterized protein BABINDRAFT_141470 [Babjeviella inositovora NRRL Y-12698]ODQ79337.1 hypothetical protein BABINDRAFT_141470 [Babjeviella inositovora NRRL Y-12698]